MTPYRLFLLIAFSAIWVWAAINPRFPHDWLLENLLVFVFVPAIILAIWHFRLSSLSCTLITAFMIMHVAGSHYTYAEMPLGYEMQRWFGTDRNMYDRVVHFCFGLLLAYPMRESFLQVAPARSFWSYWLPMGWVLSFSAIYEIIEWLVAERVDPAAGLAFLGAQGDIWDAQKDMLLAGLGAALAMAVTAFSRWRSARDIRI